MLGHYSAGFTLITYAHATAQMQEETASRIASFPLLVQLLRLNTVASTRKESPHELAAFEGLCGLCLTQNASFNNCVFGGYPVG